MNAEERKQVLAGKKLPAKRSENNGAAGRDAGKGAPQQKLTFGESVWSWTKTIVSSLLIVMVINGLLIASFVVPTGSMENEVLAGDFVFVNKFIYGGSSPQTIPFLNIPLPYFRLPGLRDPEKGDVIVFIFPGNRNEVEPSEFQYYLKRCVATAGDTLEVRNKQVFVNGVAQPAPRNVRFTSDPDERYGLFPEGSSFTRDNWGPMRIPKEGDVIPLNDSTYTAYRTFIMREGHSIALEGQIITVDGQPATSYTVKRDYAFGMGDNRDNSLDSRFWGFIPEENIVGTPLFVYWSWPVSDGAPGNTEHFYSLGEKLGRIRWSRIFTGVD